MGLSEADAARLRGLSEELLRRTRWTLGAKVQPWMALAYVQAVHLGGDVVRAIGRAHYGDGFPLYEGDPAWLDEARRPNSRTHHCVLVARLCAEAAAAPARARAA